MISDSEEQIFKITMCANKYCVNCQIYRCNMDTITDVNKDWTLKAKARTKDFTETCKRKNVTRTSHLHYLNFQRRQISHQITIGVSIEVALEIKTL